MKNMKMIGMVAGLVGGGICILGGMLCLVLGLAAIQQTSTIPPGLYWAMGLYFIGKGAFAAGISCNVADRTSPKSGDTQQ